MFISEKFILNHLFTITKVGTSLHALNFEVKIYFFSLQITFILFSRTNRWVFFYHKRQLFGKIPSNSNVNCVF